MNVWVRQRLGRVDPSSLVWAWDDVIRNLVYWSMLVHVAWFNLRAAFLEFAHMPCGTYVLFIGRTKIEPSDFLATGIGNGFLSASIIVGIIILVQLTIFYDTIWLSMKRSSLSKAAARFVPCLYTDDDTGPKPGLNSSSTWIDVKRRKVRDWIIARQMTALHQAEEGNTRYVITGLGSATSSTILQLTEQ